MSRSSRKDRSSGSDPAEIDKDGQEVHSRSRVVRREVTAIALLLFAFFIGGALAVHGYGILTASETGAGALRGSFGALGEGLARPLTTWFGWPASVLIPIVTAAQALTLFGRMERDAHRSWGMFLAGLLVLVPIAFGFSLGGEATQSALSGLWGGMGAYYLLKFAGTTGAWIIWFLAVSALTAVTLSWNPVRMIVGRRARTLDPDATGDAFAGRWSADHGKGLSVAQALEPPPEEMPAVDLALIDEVPAPGPDTLPHLADNSRPRERKPRARGPVSAGPIASTGGPAAEGTLTVDDELPPIDLLSVGSRRGPELLDEQLNAMGERLVEALRTFRVESRLQDWKSGPVVTQFRIVPATGVKVRQIANLSNDLALAMKAQSIRIVAPVPGIGAVGIEIPNPQRENVALRDLLEGPGFKSARAALPIVLGRDLEGQSVVADLAQMPHLLIAGATGSGKSVCVNTLITSLVYRHTPETLRFLMVDPKMVELSVYNVLPHMRLKVVTDNHDAASVLKYARIEMEDRYRLLAANGARNIQDFNKKVREGAKLSKPPRADVAFENLEYTAGLLPYIVVVIDELADLMMTVQAEVERPLAILAQKARAIGIHLILATQRPSVNVITGLIKANFPSRIAFRVASQVDSRTILDGIGAESLLGNGDMLFMAPGKAEPERIQGAFVSNEDTETLARWFEERKRLHGERLVPGRRVEEDVLEIVRQRELAEQGGAEGENAGDGDRDKLFREAAEAVIQHQQGSTSLLQRRLKVGYGRAARIIDQLHAAGVLGPPDGSKPRDVLMGLEDLDRILGRE